ncbi:MAG: tetratricopeptide repeat protein [Candidatus Aureabacteria bacterium]|nr:tetratricopeptide repeat protein [Candidatus Auribacterota bacterium]MCK5161685.1 tetratricopeptide repeat protein [Candidatus Auribacterota bacterium]
MNINKGIISVIIALVLIIFLVLFHMLVSRIPPFVSLSLNDAGTKFENGDFNNAYKTYGELKTKNPHLPEADYGFSNAAYKIDKYDESEAGYTKAAEAWKADKNKLFKSTYNLGNVKYRQGKLQEALDVYKKAMDMDPEDEDVKYNHEFVKIKIKEMEKSQEQRQGKKEKGEKEEKDKSETDSSQKEQDRKTDSGDKKDGKKEQKDQQKSGEKEKKAAEDQEKKDEKQESKGERQQGKDGEQEEKQTDSVPVADKGEEEDSIDKKDLAILGVLEEEEEKARKEYFRGKTRTIADDGKNW